MMATATSATAMPTKIMSQLSVPALWTYPFPIMGVSSSGGSGFPGPAKRAPAGCVPRL